MAGPTKTLGFMSAHGGSWLSKKQQGSSAGSQRNGGEGIPVATEWLDDSELAAVRNEIGPLKLTIQDSIFSEIG